MAVGQHRMGQARQQHGAGAMHGGTPGGKPPRHARAPMLGAVALGDAGYLWALIAIELTAIAGLRKYFRRWHGG